MLFLDTVGFIDKQKLSGRISDLGQADEAKLIGHEGQDLFQLTPHQMNDIR